jgi:hypothetical protein
MADASMATPLAIEYDCRCLSISRYSSLRRDFFPGCGFKRNSDSGGYKRECFLEVVTHGEA